MNFKPAILTGIKQRKYLTDLRETQNKKKKAEVRVRHKLIVGMMKGRSLAGGALVKMLRKELAEKHDVKVSERTIRSDLKTIRTKQ